MIKAIHIIIRKKMHDPYRWIKSYERRCAFQRSGGLKESSPDSSKYHIEGMHWRGLQQLYLPEVNLNWGQAAALSLNSSFPGLMTNKAWTSYKIKDYQDSLTKLDKALAVNPKDERAFYEKALVFSKLGEKHQVLEDVNKAIEINPNDTFALDLKASLSRGG